jgi:hypothetical protein
VYYVFRTIPTINHDAFPELRGGRCNGDTRKAPEGYTERVGIHIVFLARIHEVLVSNLGWDTWPTLVLSWFSSIPPEKLRGIDDDDGCL